jgi:hypothetical protein
MTLAVRFETSPFAVIRHPSGRTYSANASGIADVPAVDAEMIHGQGLRIAYTGLTSDRPKPDPNMVNWPPQRYLDTSLGVMIFWTGNSWTDASGNAV